MPKQCCFCGEPREEKRLPGYREECLKCEQPLHCCRQCRFYDSNANPWCKEPMARNELPRDPEQSNTCDYFLFAEPAERRDEEKSQAAKDKLVALFGDVPKDVPAEKPDWMKTPEEG